MSHTLQNQKKLTTRINKIQGQLNSLKLMLEGDQECIQVLQQIAAVRGGINSLMKETIKTHVQEHIIKEKDDQKRADELEVILKVLDSYLK